MNSKELTIIAVSKFKNFFPPLVIEKKKKHLSLPLIIKNFKISKN